MFFALFLRAQEKGEKKGGPQGLSRISKPRLGRDGTRRAGESYPSLPLILGFGKNLLRKSLKGTTSLHSSPQPPFSGRISRSDDRARWKLGNWKLLEGERRGYGAEGCLG